MVAASRHLLIVSHAPTGNTRELTEAVRRGARHPDIDGVVARLVAPLEGTIDDLVWAHAVVFGTTANFGYMSGALKDFFDRVYYACIDAEIRLPYALFVRASTDPTGAQISVDKIAGGMTWRSVQPAVLAVGELTPEHVARCEELGMTMAAGLEAGIF